MSDIPRFPYAMLWGERVIRSVANLTRRDAEEFLALRPTCRSGPRSSAYPLADANEALAPLRAGKLRGAMPCRRRSGQPSSLWSDRRNTDLHHPDDASATRPASNTALLQVVRANPARTLFTPASSVSRPARPLQVVCRKSPGPAVRFEEDRKAIDQGAQALLK